MNSEPTDYAKVTTKTGGLLEVIGYVRVDLTANRLLVLKAGGTIPDWEVKDLVWQDEGGLVYHTLFHLFKMAYGNDYQPVKEGGKQ